MSYQSVKDKLLEEFGCAINAVLGYVAQEEFSTEKVEKGDLEAIARKVAFYLGK